MKKEFAAKEKLPWRDYRKWKEGKTVFLLYHTDAMFQIIPKASFSLDQQAALRQILAQHLRRVA